MILLLENPADYERVVYSLARVGYENVLDISLKGWIFGKAWGSRLRLAM